jgi:hypothetical protein
VTILHLALVMVVLCAPAVLPTLAVVGPTPVSVPLLLPVGTLWAALAGEAAVATRTSIVPWLVAVDLVANVAAGASLWSRRAGFFAERRRDTAGGLSSLLVAAAAMVVGLLPLRHTVLDWDARSIWMLHARLLDAGGATYVHALQNSAYGFSHPDYPPLVPATVAVAWKVWGSPSYRVAQVVVALVGACLIVTASWLVGRRARGRYAPFLAPALSGLFALAAIGASSAYLTDGYADVVAAAAATVAALALLAEPPTPAMAGLGVAAALVAGLTKDEGLVAALIIVVLWLARLVVSHRSERRQQAVAVAAGVGIVVWPVLAAALGGPAVSVLNAPGSAPPPTARGTRLHEAFTGVRSQLPMWWLVAAALIVVAVVVATRAGGEEGTREGPGAPLAWLSALIVLDLAALLVTYTVGSAPMAWWLATSVYRVTILARLLLYAAAATAVALALGATRVAAAADDPATETQKVPATP